MNEFVVKQKKPLTPSQIVASVTGMASTQAKLFGSAQDALKAKVEELKAKISAQTDIVKLNETQQKKLEDTLKEQWH